MWLLVLIRLHFIRSQPGSIFFNPMRNRNPINGYSEGGISSGSALFAKTNSIFRERNTIFFFENLIITYDPLKHVYTMKHPDFIVCSFVENSIGLKRVKRYGIL